MFLKIKKNKKKKKKRQDKEAREKRDNSSEQKWKLCSARRLQKDN